MALSLLARLFAALIALTGVTGLGAQLDMSTGYLGSLDAALWGMARYYTNIGNAGVALILAAAAFGQAAALRPLLIGGAAINSALIGTVYALLLSGHIQPGESYLSIVLLHYVVPPLVMLFWLGWSERGRLAWRHPLLWAVPPLVYFAYVLVRAQFDGRYPYPFINVARIGWPQTLVNAVVITLGFLLSGAALVVIDRLLARQGKS